MTNEVPKHNKSKEVGIVAENLIASAAEIIFLKARSEPFYTRLGVSGREDHIERYDRILGNFSSFRFRLVDEAIAAKTNVGLEIQTTHGRVGEQLWQHHTVSLLLNNQKIEQELERADFDTQLTAVGDYPGLQPESMNDHDILFFNMLLLGLKHDERIGDIR